MVSIADEQKALEKELKALKSEQNKYNHWKTRHDQWQQQVAASQTPAVSKKEANKLKNRLVHIPAEIQSAQKQLEKLQQAHPKLGKSGAVSKTTTLGKKYWQFTNQIASLEAERADIESRLAPPVTQGTIKAEPKLATGIRTAEQIEARRAEITQRLEELRTGAAASTTGKKGKGKGKASGRAARTTVTPVAGGGITLPISESIQQLQALASEKAITLNLQMAPITAAQTQLTEQIAALQTLANEKAILFNATLTPTVTTGKKGKGKGKAAGTTVGTTAPVNTIPFEGVVENIVVSKSVKVTGGPVKVEGLVENVKAGKGMKPIELKANVVAPGLNNQVNVLRELSAVWKALPKTGSRTYTVNLKMPGIENIGKLRELAGMVGTLPQSQRRE